MKTRFAAIVMLVAYLLGNTCLAQELKLPAIHKKDRPTVAVVLAGGGAKGVAHIPALKAIEEAGLPVDLVVGTSIGSIVGALYCTGYSPDSMTQIIKGTDWIKLITDNPDYRLDKTLSGKKDDESYILRYLLDPSRRGSSTRLGGILGGANVLEFFKELTRFLPDSLNFYDMPIPFACVGTGALDGGKKVFTHGNLPTCMRASMAIPTVFTPVTIDSIVYVDGGVCDNYPVDVARAMGADIIIGIDLKVSQDDSQITNSAIDILMNCVDFYSREQYRSNLEDTDIYIPIDVTGYSAASFGATALDTLLLRGEHYVSLKKNSLDSLATALNLKESPDRIRIGEYTFANANTNSSWSNESSLSLYKANGGSLNSSFNLGYRFDNSEFASLKVRFNLVLSQKYAALMKLQARLGERFDVGTDFSIKTFGKQRFGLDYKFQRHDLKYLYNTKRSVDTEMRHNRFNIYFNQEWRSILCSFGVMYHNYHYRDILVDSQFRDYLPYSETNKYTEKHFSYYFTGEINSLDSQTFPTHGQQMVLWVDLITDNLATYKDKTMLPILSFKWFAALPLSSKFVLQPHIFTRALFKEESADKPLALFNFAGGFMNAMDFYHQNTMAGLYSLEVIREDGMGVAGLTAQYEMFKNQYLKVSGDLMSHTNNIKYAFNNESLNWGVEASYNYKTPFGPISATFYWNDLSEQFKIFFSAGYFF